MKVALLGRWAAYNLRLLKLSSLPWPGKRVLMGQGNQLPEFGCSLLPIPPLDLVHQVPVDERVGFYEVLSLLTNGVTGKCSASSTTIRKEEGFPERSGGGSAGIGGAGERGKIRFLFVSPRR